MKVKFQNSKSNRKALVEAGYVIHDHAGTFVNKPWIIIGDDGKLYGVRFRNLPVMTAEEYLSMFK